ITDEAWQQFEAKQRRLEEVKQALEKTKLTAADLLTWGQPLSAAQAEPSSAALAGSASTTQDFSSAIGQPLAQLLKRPEITIEQLAPLLQNLVPKFFERNSSANSASSAIDVSPPHLSSEIRYELKSVETEIKYA